MNLLKKKDNIINRVLSLFRKKKLADDGPLKLQQCIKYNFCNPDILIQALTHKSCVDPEDKKRLLSNERMEFLGDAVLNCLVTDHIYHRFITHSEGQLSKIKSLLVSRKIIGEVAKSIDLGRYLIMGRSEKKSGGRDRMSIISNAFEAVLGAVYLDGTIEDVNKILEPLLLDRLEEFVNDEDNVNYKSNILEMSQRDGFGVPIYPLISEDGPDHAKNFVVGLEIAGVHLGEGKGLNKKQAQQNAAYNAIQNYNKELILSRLKGV